MVYLDLLFVIHWFTDYLVWTLVKETLFPDVRERRAVIGSFLWAVSYVAWDVQMRNFPEPFSYMAAAILFVLPLLFLFPRRTLSFAVKLVGTALLYIFLLGGFCLAVQEKMPGEKGGYLWLAIFVLAVKKWRRWERKKKRESRDLYEVEVRRKGRQADTYGLYDSGNLLKSEIAGGGIFVASREIAWQIIDEKEKKTIGSLLSENEKAWDNTAELLCAGIYKIRFYSVGNKGGWMPGIRADSIRIKKDGKLLAEKKGLIGITAEELCEGKQFSILLPADIFSENK
ncbi:MAG: sigma-E processing peptidase SpoIIGA [Eubacteriales bacterium]|nr:sigma-E processing peptidase SpoIIGA [Eubacteriales bacterium]